VWMAIALLSACYAVLQGPRVRVSSDPLPSAATGGAS